MFAGFLTGVLDRGGGSGRDGPRARYRGDVMTERRTTNLKPDVLAPRRALGELLADLSEAEWDRPSLCEGWRIRDVAAHCVQSHVATPLRLVRELVAAGFNLDRRNARWVAAKERLGWSEVLGEYLTTSGRSAIPTAELSYALTETVIHGYDIAWPLERVIEVPAARLVVVADTCRRTQAFLHTRRRCAGLALRALDADWSAGSGPEVTGPLSSLIMAMAGRPAGLADLAGDGVGVLRSRVVSSER